ncbi:hypothetical protein ANO14919_006780 [Xylariales sp. No.14919]|nr:hypothetical protein ANO14919_006780 [Xylariales sp. No.14919]
MEDRRWQKRRRLNQPEITKTTPNEPDTLACAIKEGDLGFYGASNIHSNGVASEAALTDTGDSGRATFVCYGMLENLPIVSIPTAVIIDNPTLDSAYLNENGMVQRSSDGACVGKLEDKALQCLFKLHDEEMEIQFMLKTVKHQSYRKRLVRSVALASAIIYGPGDMGDDVGDFLDRCNYVLQDPFGCEHNVPYMNPHCLSTLFESPRMTFELHSPDSGHNAFTLSNSLHALETIEHLPEWPQPVALKTELHRHQKQALWFFLMRERPENLKHIWQTMTLTDGSLTYVNEITGSYQNIPPPVWNGGILADEMGLGKTLQMISLIVADREIQQQGQGPHYPSIANSHMATLVVVPLPRKM